MFSDPYREHSQAGVFLKHSNYTIWLHLHRQGHAVLQDRVRQSLITAKFFVQSILRVEGKWYKHWKSTQWSSFNILHYKIKPPLSWYLGQLVCNKDKQVSKLIFSHCQFKLVKCLWCLWSNISNLPNAGLVSQMCSEGIISIQLMRCSSSPLMYWGTMPRKTAQLLQM